MNDLLVDSGNTRLKWAVSGAGVWRAGAVTVRALDLPPLLDDAWGRFEQPQRVFVAHVGDSARWQALEAWVRRAWRAPLTRVQPSRELLGVRNGYREPQQLGADRWAALIGARALADGSAGIVSCGTAVTLDLLNAGGEYLGGVILPGLALQRESLRRGTAGLQATPGDAASCLARSTADGVAAGTWYGLAGAIERVLREFERALGEAPRIYLTGGDADALLPLMSRPVRHEPELVLNGLARIAANTAR